jgi:uncharacterized SAM-binding protein YcdF (DUF218 family)
MIRWMLSLAGLVLALPSALLWLDGVFHFGIALALVVGLVLLALASAWGPLQRWLKHGVWRRKVWRAAVGLALVWVVSVLAFFALPVPKGNAAQLTKEPRALIVLGGGSPRCQPSPVVQARLDTVYEAALRWPAALVVVSGGNNRFHDVPCTEAQVMQKALVAKGLEASRILQEEASTSTAENLAFSAHLLQDHGIAADQPMAVVTSDYHGIRAMHLGARQGLTQLQLVPAPTPIRYRYHLWMREYFAAALSWASGEG